MAHSVVVLANAVVDLCIRIGWFPVLPAEHQMTGKRLFTPGGMANSLICGARLGLETIALGNIGQDDLSDLWYGLMRAEGVNVDLVLQHPEKATTYALVLSVANGEHVFIGDRGDPNSGPAVFPASWQKVINEADAILLAGWNYLSLGAAPNLIAAELALAAGVPIFFDPGPEIPDIPSDWMHQQLAASTVTLLTREEAALILGHEAAPEAMAAAILALGPDLVILKLGGEGMIAHSATETVRQPGFKVQVEDMTAAGDSVAASVIYSYLAGHSLAQMVTLANATGAVAVSKFGAGVAVPYRHEVEALLRANGLVDVGY